jgi:hypothetical protein
MGAESKNTLDKLLEKKILEVNFNETKRFKIPEPPKREVLLKDEVLQIILRLFSKYPQFKNEASIYELKESLIFLGNIITSEVFTVRHSIKILIYFYLKDLEAIADKKKRKKTKKDHARKKAEKAIDMLLDIKKSFFTYDEYERENLSSFGLNMLNRNNYCINQLIHGLKCQIGINTSREINPTIANREFDKSFHRALERVKNKSFSSPLELAKAIEQLRVTIRNIFNNKSNIRIKSDREA